MADILKLPLDGVDAWTDFELILRRVLVAGGASRHSIEWICKDIEPRASEVFRSFTVELRVDPDLQAEGRRVSQRVIAEMRVSIEAALLQIVLLEIELYGAKHPGNPPGARLPVAAE